MRAAAGGPLHQATASLKKIPPEPRGSKSHQIHLAAVGAAGKLLDSCGGNLLKHPGFAFVKVPRSFSRGSIAGKSMQRLARSGSCHFSMVFLCFGLSADR
jgi:hypothetical protein